MLWCVDCAFFQDDEAAAHTSPLGALLICPFLYTVLYSSTHIVMHMCLSARARSRPPVHLFVCSSLNVRPGLKAAIDGGAGRKSGDWRRAKKLPAAFWSPSCKPGCFVQGDGSTWQYGDRTSELVRFIRNLWQHFADQRPEVQRAIVGCGGDDAGSASGAAALDLSVEEQEAADLIEGMLAADGDARPTMESVLGHPLFWTAGEKVRYIDRVHRSGAGPLTCNARVRVDCRIN